MFGYLLVLRPSLCRLYISTFVCDANNNVDHSPHTCCKLLCVSTCDVWWFNGHKKITVDVTVDVKAQLQDKNWSVAKAGSLQHIYIDVSFLFNWKPKTQYYTLHTWPVIDSLVFNAFNHSTPEVSFVIHTVFEAFISSLSYFFFSQILCIEHNILNILKYILKMLIYQVWVKIKNMQIDFF